MFKKILLGMGAVLSLGLIITLIHDPKSEATPQVRAAFSAQSTFANIEDAPDPNEIFRLVNEARKAEGLKPLVPNSKLTEVAEARAYDMAKNKYYGQKDKDGNFFDALFASRGFSTDYSCENLDLEFTTEAQSYVEDWLTAPSGIEIAYSIKVLRKLAMQSVCCLTSLTAIQRRMRTS